MGHVDHAHQPEDDGEAERHQEQDRAERSALEQGLDGARQEAPALDASNRVHRRPAFRRRRGAVRHEALERGDRALRMEIAEAPRRRGALGRRAVRQVDQRQRLREGVAHPAIGFLLQRVFDDGCGGGNGLVAELHGGAAPYGGVGVGELRLRLIGVEERLDGQTEAPVGRHFFEIGQRHRAERRAIVGGADVDHVLVALRGLAATDHELGLAGARARVDATVAERAQELNPLRIARLANHGDGRFPLVRVVAGEIGERRGDFGGGRGSGGRVARCSRGEPRDQRKEYGETGDHAFF